MTYKNYNGNTYKKYNKRKNTYKRQNKNTHSKTKMYTHPNVSFPHFRIYYKSQHPALIIDELKPINAEEEWVYRKVMHGEKDGRRSNEKISPNPDPSDKQPMYIGKRKRHDKKIYFSNKTLSWKYPKNKKE